MLPTTTDPDAHLIETLAAAVPMQAEDPVGAVDRLRALVGREPALA